jgi:hypothetical protein
VPQSLLQYDAACELPPAIVGAGPEGGAFSGAGAAAGAGVAAGGVDESDGIRIFTSAPRAAQWVHSDRHVAAGAAACARAAMLCPHNRTVDEHNLAYLRAIQGDAVTLYATEKPQRDDCADGISLMTTDFMARISEPGKPDHELVLKAGALAMVTRNLFLANRLLNGSRVVVDVVTRKVVVVRALLPPAAGSRSDAPCALGPRVLIPRITCDVTVPGGGASLTVKRTQFPLRVAYAITTNRSQGKTLARACLDIRSDVFGHGQLYVALGRVCDRGSLALLVDKARIVRDPADGSLALIVRNVVYPELLQPGCIDPATVHGAQWPSEQQLEALPPMPPPDLAVDWEAVEDPQLPVDGDPSDVAMEMENDGLLHDVDAVDMELEDDRGAAAAAAL